MEALEIFQYIDYIGTFALAITGAFIASDIDLDLFGIVFLAMITALGGGTVRDVILDLPVFWVEDPMYVFIALCSSPLVYLIKKPFKRISKLLFTLDTLGLSFYAIIGVQKALFHESHYLVAFIMGIITAVLGGIIRSLFSREESILYKRELYATVAAFSSLLYIVLQYLEINTVTAIVVVSILTYFFRTLSIKFDLGLPKVSR